MPSGSSLALSRSGCSGRMAQPSLGLAMLFRAGARDLRLADRRSREPAGKWPCATPRSMRETGSWNVAVIDHNETPVDDFPVFRFGFTRVRHVALSRPVVPMRLPLFPCRPKWPWCPLSFAHDDDEAERVTGDDRAEQIAIDRLAPVSFPNGSFMSALSASLGRPRELDRPRPQQQNKTIGANADQRQALYCASNSRGKSKSAIIRSTMNQRQFYLDPMPPLRFNVIDGRDWKRLWR